MNYIRKEKIATGKRNRSHQHDIKNERHTIGSPNNFDVV